MRVLLAHALAPKRRRLTRVLSAAGHEVSEVDNPVEALERCRAWAPDVALIGVECCGDLVCAIKSDPVAYGTAIIIIERPGLAPAQAVEGIRKGIQDYLVEPVSDGEVLTRVVAAARTKELQLELVAQGARLEAQLREDALTGLSNRRAILTQLGGVVSAARRHGHPLSIAILDLDHFKRVNDSHGHKIGDHVLVTAAHAVGTHLREEDQLGRLGGEEFLVLLPDTNVEAAVLVAEKLRVAVACAPTAVPVTVSIGLATWDGEAPEDLLQRADEALYGAKDAGRDRVMAASLHGRT
jgi:two-component system cell cycle response regulator